MTWTADSGVKKMRSSFDELGVLTLHKLARSGDSAQFVLHSGWTPEKGVGDYSKVITLSLLTQATAASDAELWAEVYYQCMIKEKEILADYCAQKFGEDWKAHYDAAIAKHDPDRLPGPV